MKKIVGFVAAVAAAGFAVAVYTAFVVNGGGFVVDVATFAVAIATAFVVGGGFVVDVATFAVFGGGGAVYCSPRDRK